MKTLTGDLVHLALGGEFDVIIHGCNCFHAMGAGIAKPIAHAFPEALKADKATPYGDRSKLGTISVARVERDGLRLSVINVYTQFHWKGSGRKADYDAISAAFACVADAFPDARMGYPMIGAGLAGGDWSEIAPRIEVALCGLDHTLVLFSS